MPRTSNPCLLAISSWMVAALLVLAAASAAAWILSRPMIFHPAYAVLQPHSHSDDAGRIVRWLANPGVPAEKLNESLTGGQLNWEELRHYREVQNLFFRLPLFFGAALVLNSALIWGLRIPPTAVQAALLRGVALVAGALVLGTALALWNWRAVFYWLHYPFFGAETWKLPKSSYSLQLFPASFWQSIAVAAMLLGLLLVPLLQNALKWLARARLRFAPRGFQSQ